MYYQVKQMQEVGMDEDQEMDDEYGGQADYGEDDDEDIGVGGSDDEGEG